LEPISHFFYSHRLKLQFWDWGMNGKPPLLLVHGGLDHARNWDWVARVLRDNYHVYAVDLRGHGNSAWSPGAMYSVAEHVLDVSALVDIISRDQPLYLIGHSLGGIIASTYAGVYPERVRKLVSIEGLGFPPGHRIHAPAPQRIRNWIEETRRIEQRKPHSYSNLAAAVSRMKEANPHLSDAVAEHLTLHGTNWNADGSIIWKFDNFARLFPPYGQNHSDAKMIFGNIQCPVLFFWGDESFMPDPEPDERFQAIRNCKLVKVHGAGHWLHHDQLGLFLEETGQFLAKE